MSTITDCTSGDFVASEPLADEFDQWAKTVLTADSANAIARIAFEVNIRGELEPTKKIPDPLRRLDLHFKINLCGSRNAIAKSLNALHKLGEGPLYEEEHELGDLKQTMGLIMQSIPQAVTTSITANAYAYDAREIPLNHKSWNIILCRS